MLHPVYYEHRRCGTCLTKMSLQQEFIAMLEKHGVEYDPRYVFD